MSKKYIGKYLTFKFTGRKYDLTGIVIAYNKTYTLIKIFRDYCPNGFHIFKNDKVEFHFGDSEKIATKIIRLKKYSITNEPTIPIDTLDNILTYINKQYKLIGLETRKGDSMDVVRYLGQNDGKYSFDELTPSAKWRYKLQLEEKECRFIEFDTNYLNSLKLITKF
jgi:hypothetical protein